MNKPASRCRAIAAIASLSAALVLTGCSADGDVPPPVAAESSGAATTSPSQQPVSSSSPVAGAELPGTVAAPELFVGTWQDTTDPRSQMSFAADGTLTTSYEGMDATKSGIWELISTAEVEGVQAKSFSIMAQDDCGDIQQVQDYKLTFVTTPLFQ